MFSAAAAALPARRRARSRRSCSGGFREARVRSARSSRRLRRGARGGRRLRAARTSVTGSWCASPSRARGSSSRSAAECRVRSRVPADLPARPHRRRARRASSAERAIDVIFLGTLGSPVNPGITTVAIRGLRRRPTSGAAARAADASGRSSAACPRRAAARRVPTSVSAFPPGRPTVRRVPDGTRPAGDGDGDAALRRPRAARRRGARVGFATRTPPSASLVASVPPSQSVRGRAGRRHGARPTPSSATCERSSRCTPCARWSR